MSQPLYEKLRELCSERGMSLTQLEYELGFSKGSITKKPSSPSFDRLIAIAKYFGVSVDYLVGASELRSGAEDVLRDETIISIQRAMQHMTEEDRRRAVKILEAGFSEAFSHD